VFDVSVNALASDFLHVLINFPLKRMWSTPFHLCEGRTRQRSAFSRRRLTEMGAALKIEREFEVKVEGRTQSRTTTRVDAYLCIDLCSEHNFWTGLTMNISEGGVFVATHHILPAGSLVGLHLELPHEKRIMVLGEVKWSRDYTGNDDVPPGLGIQFVGLDTESVTAIRRFMMTMREPLLFES